VTAVIALAEISKLARSWIYSRACAISRAVTNYAALSVHRRGTRTTSSLIEEG
jgi:hypothetical protein